MTAIGRRVMLSSAAACAMAISGVAAGAHSEAEITSVKFAAPPPNAVVVPKNYLVILEPGALPPSETAGSSAAAVMSARAKKIGGDVSGVFDALDVISGEFTNAELNKLMKDPAVKLVEPDYVRTATGILYTDQVTSAANTESKFKVVLRWLRNTFGLGGDQAQESEPAAKPEPATKPKAPVEKPAKAADSKTETEQDRTVGVAQNGATWGLDRIDQRGANLDRQFNPDGTGNGVHTYVIDTGINRNHQEFTGRIGNGYDAIDGDNDPADCAGHGTHVAGTVAGTTYGVAKGAIVHGVRVLGCDGRSSGSSVARGMNWVVKNAQKPAVANLSLGGPANRSDDRGVQAMTAAGITVVVAAGNSSMDACRTSPARAPEAITVASSARGDRFSSFSNYGRCVDIIAPGSQITSAWWTSNTGTSTISGTSMAAPHVAGVAALYLGKNPSATPQQVTNAILGAASNISINARAGTPQKMLYAKFTGADTNPNPVRPNPGQPNPGNPGQPQPGNPVKPNPVQPQPGNPVKPNPGNPGQPQPGNPVKPNPVQPQPGNPVKPNPGQPNPVQPQPGNPVKPNPGQPNPLKPQPGNPVVVIPEKSPQCGWVTKSMRATPNQLLETQRVTLWMKDRLIGCTRSMNGGHVDLYLQRMMGKDKWQTVAKGTDFEGGMDQLVVDAPPGTYRFVAHGVGNGGSFRFGYSRQ